MTLDAIKHEISDELRRVRSEAADLSDAELYPELQKLIARAVSRVALCESATDLERLNDLFNAIEDTYNSCRAEITGATDEIALFDLDFELDGDNDGSDADFGHDGNEDEPEDEEDEADDCDEETDGEDEGISPEHEREIAACVAEIEEFYKKNHSKGGLSERNRLKALRSRALDRVEATRTTPQLTDAVIAYRKSFAKYEKSLASYDRFQAAKPAFDKDHKLSGKLNFVRLAAGILATVGGVVYGLVSDPQWDSLSIAVTCFGGIYILMSALYAILSAATKKRCTSVYRSTAFARLILAAVALTASITVGIVFPDFGIPYALLASSPLTLLGIAVYLLCRIKLSMYARHQRSPKKHP